MIFSSYCNCSMQFSIVDTVLLTLSSISTTTGIILVWDPLTPVSNVTYEYEVAYSVDPECSGDHVSLPDGYTLYYPRTSNNYIQVVGLMSGTCYVFGVRAYTSVTDYPGEFSLVDGKITGCIVMFLVNHLTHFGFLDQYSSNTGLIAGSVTLSIITVVLVGLLIVVTVALLYYIIITKKYRLQIPRSVTCYDYFFLQECKQSRHCINV